MRHKEAFAPKKRVWGGDKMIMEIKAINVIASQAPIAILLLSLNGHYGVPKLPTRNRLFGAPGCNGAPKFSMGSGKRVNL